MKFSLANLFKINKRSNIAEVDINGLPVLNNYLTPIEGFSVNTVHSCINIIAGSIACLPLVLYNKKENGREKATEHKMFGLTKKPNPNMTSMSFMYALIVNLLLHGNAYCRIYKPNGKVCYLTLIPSKYVTINVKKGEVTYTVAYNPNNPDLAQEYKKKDILHIVGESLDGIHGISPIDLLNNTIKFAQIMEKYGLKYFENGASPTGTINFPEGKTVKGETAEKIKKTIEEYYQGINNVGRLMVLDDGAIYKQTQNNNDSSQFLETKESLVEEIARIFNVPLHLLQKTDKATSWGSGIEQMGSDFLKFNLNVHLKRIEQAFDNALLTDSERNHYYFEFNIDSFLRANHKERYEAYEIGLRSGFMSPNEIRQKENMPAIKGGNLFCLMANQPPYTGEDFKEYLENNKNENN